ncbi:adp-ribose 1 phosphate phosphatase [Zalerion maritima]|uniref:Adp-ribose 1 phosphate phosphatase n=1 Tax=Zalerion maritima TaxID=339359 RepID=A0AAD5RIU3_9PEZI|nr:adp-ribose 1 phosphate phosphatase [Zalerion maritima]
MTTPALTQEPKAASNVLFNLTYSPPIPLDSLPAKGCYLVHATNCLGIWGAGVAAELKMLYPRAFESYKTFCNVKEEGGGWSGRDNCGSCLVCEPEMPKDGTIGEVTENESGKPDEGVRVVCLCTSWGFGKGGTRSSARGKGGPRGKNGGSGRPGKDPPDVILRQTESALREFREILQGQRVGHRKVVIYSPRFNAGLFKVPWERTEAKIREVFQGFEGIWVVIEPPQE